jgi:hypothetical protein
VEATAKPSISPPRQSRNLNLDYIFMARLVIIGNGFDIAHGIPSNYHAFRDHIKHENTNLYETLIELGGEDVWGDLEENLAKLDLERIVDAAIAETIEFDRSPKNDRYNYSAARSIENRLNRISESITADLQIELKKWIRFIDNEPIHKTFAAPTDADCIITFNYTSTIERAYDYHPLKTYHIHNKIDSYWEQFECSPSESNEYDYTPIEDVPLVFGHGIEDIQRPANFHIPCADYGYDAQILIQSSYNNACGIFNKSFKDTSRPKMVLKSFLKSIGKIDSILIIGHSLSSVDIEYFKIISDHAQPDATYDITYFGEENRCQTIERSKTFTGEKGTVKIIDLSKPNYLAITP